MAVICVHNRSLPWCWLQLDICITDVQHVNCESDGTGV